MNEASALGRARRGFLLAIGAIFVWLFKGRTAQAAASAELDKIAMATGPLDSDGEIVYTLDALTGDLRGFTMHQGGKFSASFYRNILADFELDKSKATPMFIMVTGAQRFPRRGSINLASSVLYVSEASSGRMAAYTVPWSGALWQKQLDPKSPAQIQLIDGVVFRANIVRKAVSE